MLRLVPIATAALALFASGFSQSLLRIADPQPANPWQQLDPAKAGSASTEIKWTKFTDPNEHAFTVDVPEGWETVGGAVRRNAIDVTAFLRIVSPDLSMMLLVGDPGPAFFHTIGFAAQRGDRQYEEGKEYARWWGEQMLPALCSDLQFLREELRPDLEKEKFAVKGFANHAGEVVFSCTHRGKPNAALVVASTYWLPVGCCDRSTIWGVNLLYAWIGPEDRLPVGRRVIEHMMLTARNDSEWEKAQAKRIGDVWDKRFRPDGTQTPEWEETRTKAEVQLKEINQKFNPQPATVPQP